MLRPPASHVWAFDAEWVPDLPTGRRVLDLGPEVPDAEVLEAMWAYGGATPENPRPYLKTMLCRVVSIAAVIRTVRGDEVSHRLFALPDRPGPMAEDELLRRFLVAMADKKPQLVGFNSREADLPILVQRAMANGLSVPGLGRTHDKWAKDDFFDRYGNQHVDLREALGGWGKATPSLHELATACGIPGKLGTDGASVVDLWADGNIEHIVRYNLFDALTTFLVWLRAQCLSGHLSLEQEAQERASIRHLVEERTQLDPVFGLYLEGWDRLSRLM